MNYNYKQRSAAATPPQPVQQAPVQVQQSQSQIYQAPPPTMPPPAYGDNQQRQNVGGIRRCDARNKVLSFHPKLSLPEENNYPALHRGSSSEKESGPTSCIALNLTDYSGKAKGSASVYATINLPVDDVFYWRTIVEIKMADGKNNYLPTLESALNQLRELAKKDRSNQALLQCGATLGNVVAGMKGSNADAIMRREIINPYGEKDSAGRYPVRKLTVTYQPVYNGKVSNYPWCVNIANGYGIMEKDDVGRTICQRGSYQETAKASINIDTKQLYCALRGVCSYIETWETCVAGPMVLNMESRRNSARR